MNGLYKKVLKGAYPEIPKKYTKDLSDIIQKMLSVEPKLRPSCAHLLETDIIQRRMAKLFPNNELEYDSSIVDESTRAASMADERKNMLHQELLNTIRVPNNLAQLTKRLPKSNYNMGSKIKSIQPTRND